MSMGLVRAWKEGNKIIMYHTREDEERLFKRIKERHEKEEKKRKKIEDEKFNKLMKGGEIMKESKEDKITYKDLEDKIKNALNYSVGHGNIDGFVHARNLSETLVNLVKAGNERMSRKE